MADDFHNTVKKTPFIYQWDLHEALVNIQEPKYAKNWKIEREEICFQRTVHVLKTQCQSRKVSLQRQLNL